MVNYNEVVSKIDYKYIEDLKKYHNECRKYFNLLNNEQIDIVEFYFSQKLFECYFILLDYDKCKEMLEAMKVQYSNYETYCIYKIELKKFLEKW